MKCFNCDKFTNDYKKDKTICASCREVLKIDLIQIVLERDPIYLSESNRNKHGRKPRLTADEQNDIQCDYGSPSGNRKITIRDLAKKYKVSVGTISRIIHN